MAINGQCAAVDPEGDLVTFQLVDKPARGQVALQEDGYFCYTPYENKKGKDTFTYVAVDANGNISQEATVKVTIEKPLYLGQLFRYGRRNFPLRRHPSG